MDECPECLPYDLTKWFVVLHECRLGSLKSSAMHNLAPNAVIRTQGFEDLLTKVVACAQERRCPEGKAERQLAIELPKSFQRGNRINDAVLSLVHEPVINGRK